MMFFCNLLRNLSLILIFISVLGRFVSYLLGSCQTPDQTKIKIQSNQKSGEALYLGSCLFVVRRNAVI